MTKRRRPVATAPEANELLPGLWRLIVPLPGHSIGHVNSYVLLNGDLALLIDTGWAVAASDLDALLRRLGTAPESVRRVLLTHSHADHSGLAGWFQERGALVSLHADDASQLTARYRDTQAHVSAVNEWLTAVGAPEDVRAAARMQVADTKRRWIDSVPDHLVKDGEEIPFGPFELVALHTPGHTAGHVCYFEKTTGTLFTGDNVFPRSNYNATARPLSPPDPLGGHRRSLTRMAALPVARVLPGHDRPFLDLRGRVAELQEHHERRCLEILSMLNADTAADTAWSVARRIVRGRDWDGLRTGAQLSAAGDALAYLIHLRETGRAVERAGSPSHWGRVPAS